MVAGVGGGGTAERRRTTREPGASSPKREPPSMIIHNEWTVRRAPSVTARPSAMFLASLLRSGKPSFSAYTSRSVSSSTVEKTAADGTATISPKMLSSVSFENAKLGFCIVTKSAPTKIAGSFCSSPPKTQSVNETAPSSRRGRSHAVFSDFSSRSV